jgi:tetratricopeptide (TPR) repeat protein
MTNAPLLVLLGSLMLAPAAIAAEGGGGGGGGNTDARLAMPPLAADPAYARAVAEANAGRYDHALPLLREVVARDPRSADGYNMMGYSLRKLGQHQQAMFYYAEALRLDPKHLGALEYQGELYIQLGNVAAAEANLAQLARLCGRCEQHNDLAQAVAAFKAKPRG